MALKIYGIPRSRAIRTIWMAYELGIDFQLIEVPPGPEGSRRPEYLALNPNGHVPFIDDDGLVLWESMAINLYLARKHGGLVAPQNLREEGLAMAWTAWALTEVEPNAALAMYHTAMLPEAERVPAKAAEGLAAVAAPLNVLEAALAKGGGWAMGNRFTVADLNLYGAVFYLRFTPQALAGKPAIAAWMDACRARPAAKRAFALRGE
jgi:glutathione S-transferase